MILEIAQNGKYCINRENGNGECWTWKEIQTYIETGSPREMKFTYTLEHQEERDNLGYLTDLVLCVYCHPDTSFKLFIECPIDRVLELSLIHI